MKYFFNARDTEHDLDDALRRGPTWSTMTVSRYEHGYTFAGAMGVYFSMDQTGECGFLPVTDSGSLAVYVALGNKQGSIFVDTSEEERQRAIEVAVEVANANNLNLILLTDLDWETLMETLRDYIETNKQAATNTDGVLWMRQVQSLHDLLDDKMGREL